MERHSSSLFASEGTGTIRNDAGEEGPMAQMAVRAREEGESLMPEVGFSLPWVEVSYHVGDCVRDLDGRSTTLFCKPGEEPRYPMVRRVSYDFRSQHTNLEMMMSRPKSAGLPAGG